MKKTYSSPKVKVVRIAKHLMQDTSLTGKQGQGSLSVTFSDDTYDGEAASRRKSVWDDEEEEGF